MASSSRRQIESWLKTIEVKGSVLDVGGLFMPVKGRTKTWDVDVYDILDVKEGRKGIKTDLVFDMNYEVTGAGDYDNVFCLEVVDHFWNPVMAFQNMNTFMNRGGMLYISSNFLFPHHTGFDCIRLTKTGLSKILTETGFEVLEITPRYAVDDGLQLSLAKESKVQYHPGEIGYMTKARHIRYGYEAI